MANTLPFSTSSSSQFPTLSIKLTRDNYFLWKSTVFSALEAFGLDTFVTSSSPPPHLTPEPSATATSPSPIPNPDYETWKKKDRLFLIWLKTHLTESMLGHVARSTTSYSAWTSLEKIFQSQTRARLNHLKHSLQSLQKSSLPMMEYIDKKRNYADSIAKCDHPITDADLMSHILNGPDASYAPFKTVFNMQRDPMLLDDFIGALLGEEVALNEAHTGLLPLPIPGIQPTPPPASFSSPQPLPTSFTPCP